MALTPNMGMTLPTPTVTPGPLYATENNQAFTVIDAHDHTPGNGVSIPSNGININGDLAFNSYNASLLRSSQYVSQSAPLTLPADLRSIYSVNGDLYYNNGIGQPIQITAGAALNATSIGGIGGDYATSTASVFYTSADETFTFWSASNTTASIEAGPLTIRNNNLNSFGVTINADPTISANYALFLPPALPVSGTKFLTVDASGNIADMYDVDNSTIEVSSNVIQVKAQGITATQIANLTITGAQIANATIDQTKLTGFIANIGTSQTFTTSGSFVVPADVSRLYITAAGGGGAGGYGSPISFGGGGGGGGNLVMGFFTVTPGETLTITIGTGGNRHAGGSGDNGTATTIVGSMTGTIVEADGGGGGILGSNGSGGAGGLGGGFGYSGFPGNGTVSAGPGGAAFGRTGSVGRGVTNTGGQGAQTNTGGGGGGGGSYGAGGAGGTLGGDGLFGGGGGGGNGTDRNAGFGGNGIVIIDII